MWKYFKNLGDKNIYRVALCIIKKNENYCSDLSRKENILNMKCEFIREIFVEKTISNNYVREIITGILIPVRFDRINDFNYDKEPYFTYNHVNYPVYVRAGINMNGYFYCSTSANKFIPVSKAIVDKDELETYLLIHDDLDLWKNDLENIFLEGEKRYKESMLRELNNNLDKTDIKIKQLVK